MPTRVVVNGALGRMGQEVVRAVLADSELRLVGAVEDNVPQPYLPVPEHPDLIPFSPNLGSLIEKTCPDVVVDFTAAQAVMAAARVTLPSRVCLVTGTTGLSEAEFDEIADLCARYEIGAVAAANFSLGAVLLMHLASVASRFFSTAEIIEMHHEKKLDAPSGTALATARKMVESRGADFVHAVTEREVLGGVRGGDWGGVGIHSVRLPGIMATQEVLFGGKGQTLLLRHDATSRESYMPGVILAVKEVVGTQGLVRGLDTLLGL